MHSLHGGNLENEEKNAGTLSVRCAQVYYCVEVQLIFPIEPACSLDSGTNGWPNNNAFPAWLQCESIVQVMLPTMMPR